MGDLNARQWGGWEQLCLLLGTSCTAKLTTDCVATRCCTPEHHPSKSPERKPSSCPAGTLTVSRMAASVLAMSAGSSLCDCQATCSHQKELWEIW